MVLSGFFRDRGLCRIMALFLVVLTIPAFAGKYRIVACGDYPGSGSDLATYDAGYFDDEMSYYGLTCDRFYEDSSVSYYSFKPNTRLHYFYYAGHGDYAELCASDGYDEWSVTQYTFGEVGNVKHFIFASCYSVDEKYSWSYCFGNGLKTVLGYRDSISNGECWHIARNYPSAVAYKNIDDSTGHIKEWFDENDYSYSTDYKAAAIGYDSTGYLSHWTWLDVDSKSLRSPKLISKDRIDLHVKRKDLDKLCARKIHLLSGEKGTISRSVENDMNIEVSDISREQACEIAARVVFESNGQSMDFARGRKMELVRENIDTGASQTVCYSFSWEREFNGLPVSGYRGDIARVRINGDGTVSLKETVYRELSKSRDIIDILSAEEVLDLCAKEIGSSVRGKKRICITGIDLVYFSPESVSGETQYKPAYRFEINGSWYIFADAASGKLL